MKPKILLLDEPHPKAKAIMESVTECINSIPTRHEQVLCDFIYTQLTSIKTNIPVFCPCTRIDHIQAPKIFYLDNEWKRTEGQSVTSTAEHTFSLILQLAKMNRMQLYGKTLGVIGNGRLGRLVERYARSFQMNTIVYNKEGGKIDFIYAGETNNINNWTFEKLLQQSDIITLHVPLNKETNGMIGLKEFDMMKPGCLLVNTSRAEIVDKNSLIKALHKDLGGYADDFLNERPVFASNIVLYPRPFPKRFNVIQTPSIGGDTLEAREATDIYIANKIVEMIKEEK
jgi:phosphoglycerate dehydrogenase-like enzyme